MLAGVAGATKTLKAFKAKSVTFAINATAKAARTTGLPKAAATMADVAAKIPVGSSTVGEIIANSVQRLDSLCDEILKTGKPLEDFGVYAENQLASLDANLVTQIGLAENEDAMRGLVKLKDMMGDKFETDFIDAHRATDGTLDVDSVVSDLKDWYSDNTASAAWMQRVRDGNAFDELRSPEYLYNQVYVVKPSGKGYFRLDSYNPATGMIVSRKYTQFVNITEATGKKYIDELAAKYPSGATIADVKSNTELRRTATQLQGNLYLEVPVQTGSIPESVLAEARAKNVTIIDVNGTTY